MRVFVLGCGVSSGVPSLEGGWGQCDPSNPKNRRTRASILIEEQGYRLLVDTSPDLLGQLLSIGINRVDGVLYTHAHADHTHGIDDLRGINRVIKGPLPAWADEATLSTLLQHFGYAFQELSPGKGIYRPWLQPHHLGSENSIGPLHVQTFLQSHGYTTSRGVRTQSFAYTTDVVCLSEDAFSILEGVDTWMVGVIGPTPHPTHAHVDLALEWRDRIKPRRTLLTHMGAGLDFDALQNTLPPGVEPAWDGMILDIP